MSLDPLMRAIEIADEARRTPGCGPFGAVVVRHDAIVGEAGNRVVIDRDPSAHAEILAIRKAGLQLGTHRLDDCVLYCSSEPCPMCLAAVEWAGIPRIVFAASREDAERVGFGDLRIHEEIAKPWPGRTLAYEQRQREAAIDVLRRWAEDPDRISY